MFKRKIDGEVVFLFAIAFPLGLLMITGSICVCGEMIVDLVRYIHG